MDNIMLSQLVCTRIIHDLIGNAGALSNALELIEDDDPESFLDVKKIFSTTSDVLSARMCFFRLAFGIKKADLSDNEKVFSVINDYLRTLGSMSHGFYFATEGTLPEHNRIILLSVMILADLALRGGEIKTCYENGSLWVAISVERGLSEDKLNCIKSIISGSQDYNDAQYAHILYLEEYLKDKGKLSLIENDKETVVFNIKFF